VPPARPAWIALGFALAALFACWSPLAAPFGLLTGVGAAVLAWRARRQGGRLALLALGLALLAAAGSALVVGRTAGLGSGPDGLARLPAGNDGETARRLDGAAAESRAERRRATEQADPAAIPRPRN
jgi:hypothetical protein